MIDLSLYTKEYVDKTYPKHCRTSCSDKNPVNVDATGTGCHRCNALAFAEANKLQQKLNNLASTLSNAGRFAPSEEDLIADGVKFADYEKGFNAAASIIERQVLLKHG